MSDDELIIDRLAQVDLHYSELELATLCRITGRRWVPGTGAEELAALEQAEHDRLIEHGGAGLIARGIIEIPDADGERPELKQPHASVLHLATSAPLTAVVQRQSQGTVESRTFYADDVAALVHSRHAPRVHAFRFLHARDVADRMADAAGLVERPASGAPAALVPARALEELAGPIGEGSAAALAALPDSAAAFREALPHRVGSGRIRCMRRTGDRYDGVELVWVDTGDHGLWEFDLPEDQLEVDPLERLVEVAPTSAAAIRARYAAVLAS